MTGPTDRSNASPTEFLTALIARQTPGETLLPEFYSDPAIFDRDIECIHLRQWLCVGHESRIPNRGDWFRFDIANESLILVRGRDDEIHALVNVCRHRGSRVCVKRTSRAAASPRLVRLPSRPTVRPENSDITTGLPVAASWASSAA